MADLTLNTLQYFICYKPYGMLSQFTPEAGKKTLRDLFSFPKDVYPVGRLDADSEGLLILTNDKKLNHRLLNPLHAHCRTYLVQVEGNFSDNGVSTIEKGVTISINGKRYVTKKCKVRIVSEPPVLPERNPPIRYRKKIPTSWIEITLTEGKNRQVRKMTAATGYPTLRLIRTGIEGLLLNEMKPGDVMEPGKEDVYDKLKIIG